jgi:hypothetical protein
MKRDRFWFGTAMIAMPLVLLLVTTTPGIQLTRSGTVEGHVTFHGRPLAGGSILFVPEDRSQGEWAMAWTDENGNYTISSIWSRKASDSKVRYRICLIPDSHKLTSKTVLRAAWCGQGDVAFPPPASSDFPAKVCDPKTTQLQVALGSEPARIDVTF